MGRLPFSGEWACLEVPAAAVGLEGATVTGMAYTLVGGRATWDYSGVQTAPPASMLLTLSLVPRSVLVGTRSVTVRAVDSGNGLPVAGRVLLRGQDVAATNVPFTRQYAVEDNQLPLEVRCPGYAPKFVHLTVRDVDDPVAR
jgi:hypothetical protein